MALIFHSKFLGLWSFSWTLLLLAILILLVHRLASIIHNLYFYPLRDFPGSKLAAAGHYYEVYHDLFQDGMYAWEIKRMHKRYYSFPKRLRSDYPLTLQKANYSREPPRTTHSGRFLIPHRVFWSTLPRQQGS